MFGALVAYANVRNSNGKILNSYTLSYLDATWFPRVDKGASGHKYFSSKSNCSSPTHVFQFSRSAERVMIGSNIDHDGPVALPVQLALLLGPYSTTATVLFVCSHTIVG